MLSCNEAVPLSQIPDVWTQGKKEPPDAFATGPQRMFLDLQTIRAAFRGNQCGFERVDGCPPPSVSAGSSAASNCPSTTAWSASLKRTPRLPAGYGSIRPATRRSRLATRRIWQPIGRSERLRRVGIAAVDPLLDVRILRLRPTPFQPEDLAGTHARLPLPAARSRVLEDPTLRKAASGPSEGDPQR